MTRSQTTPQSSQIIWMEGRIVELENQLAAANELTCYHIRCRGEALTELDHIKKQRDELLSFKHRHEFNARTGAAIQRACELLPFGYDIHVELEKDAGSVRLYLADTDADVTDFGGDDLSEYIDNAINIAISHAEGGTP